jgi:hypothetical protein
LRKNSENFLFWQIAVHHPVVLKELLPAGEAMVAVAAVILAALMTVRPDHHLPIKVDDGPEHRHHPGIGRRIINPADLNNKLLQVEEELAVIYYGQFFVLTN